MTFLKKNLGPFAVLVGIGLGIVSIALGVNPDALSFDKGTIHIAILSVLSVSGCAVVLLSLWHLITKALPKVVKRAMAWVALQAVDRAIAEHTITVEWTAITRLEDDIGVGLAIGSSDGVFKGNGSSF